jgi:hypothetical protein
MITPEKITATVDSHGGLCTSEEHIDHLIQQYQNITAKKTALRNHILYYKLVSKITVCFFLFKFLDDFNSLLLHLLLIQLLCLP